MRFNNGVRILSALALALVLGACSSKKKTEDGSQTVDGSTPVVDNTPMNFDVGGSDSGNISGLSSIRFEYDRSALSADARAKVKGNADWMKSNPGVTVQIEGHCDNRGTIEYNLALGERRAQAVRSYMIGLGIPGSRLNIISYGEERPLARGDSEADHATNRRANFVPISQ